jgi:hypothetical protein
MCAKKIKHFSLTKFSLQLSKQVFWEVSKKFSHGKVTLKNFFTRNLRNLIGQNTLEVKNETHLSLV